MKGIYKYLLLASILSFTILSCENGELKIDTSDSLVMSLDSAVVSPMGGSVEVVVASNSTIKIDNIDALREDKSGQWITPAERFSSIAPGLQMVILYVESTQIERTGTVTIKNDSKTIDFTIKQDAPIFTVSSKDNLTNGEWDWNEYGKSGEFSIKVDSNVDWDLSCINTNVGEYIVEVIDSIDRKRQFTLSSATNYTFWGPADLNVYPKDANRGEAVSRQIIYLSSDHVSNDYTRNFEFIQDYHIFKFETQGASKYTIDPYGQAILNVDELGGTYSGLALKSECSWHLADLSESWLRFSQECFGTGNGKDNPISTRLAPLSVDINKTKLSRTAKAKFVCDGGAETYLTVNQDPYIFEVYPLSFEFKELEMSTGSVMITSSGNWTYWVNDQLQWLNVIQTTKKYGAGGETTEIKFNPNTYNTDLNNSRIATINIYSEDLGETRTVTVKQDKFKFAVDKSSLTFKSSDKGGQSVTIISSCAWKLDEIPSWLDAEPKSGDPGETEVKFEIKKAPQSNTTDTIKVKPQGVDGVKDLSIDVDYKK